MKGIVLVGIWGPLNAVYHCKRSEAPRLGLHTALLE
jgi:hypothetical protein